MRRIWQLTGIVLIAGGAVVAPAMAGEEGTVAERGASFGARAAFFAPKEDEADDVWFGGGQLRFYLADSFALEGSIDYRTQDVGNTTIQTYPVQASLLVYLLNKKPVGLFVLGGAGWYFTHVDVDGGNDHSDSLFGTHAGGGLQVFLSDDWSVDGTWRYVWLESLDSEDETNVLEKDYDGSGQMATMALNYHF